MARSYAPLYTSIWSDPDFTSRSANAQRVFLLALSQSNISYAGVLSYTAKRWARMARDTDVADIEKAVSELVESRFLLLDHDTEEVMVRSFVRHNGVLKQPQLRKAMDSAFRDILSSRLRAALLAELPPEDRLRLKGDIETSRSEPLAQPAQHPASSLPEGSNKETIQLPAEPVSVSVPKPSSSSSLPVDSENDDVVPSDRAEEEDDELTQQATPEQLAELERRWQARRNKTALEPVTNPTAWRLKTLKDILEHYATTGDDTKPHPPGTPAQRPHCDTCNSLSLIEDHEGNYQPCPDCTAA